jgi:uncharacterized ParB-like nuclease family protein
MPDRQFMDATARTQFEDARRREWIAALTDALYHAPHDLLAFEEVRQRLQIHGQRSLGLQTIPLDHIIGSEGRYGDFDRHFLPKTDHTRDRWMNVNKAALQYIDLPPIDVYKIGDIYFVRDGNHRISVARRLGQRDIDANVTELQVDVPMTRDLTVAALPLKEEYSDFLEWTPCDRNSVLSSAKAEATSNSSATSMGAGILWDSSNSAPLNRSRPWRIGTTISICRPSG